MHSQKQLHEYVSPEQESTLLPPGITPESSNMTKGSIINTVRNYPQHINKGYAYMSDKQLQLGLRNKLSNKKRINDINSEFDSLFNLYDLTQSPENDLRTLINSVSTNLTEINIQVIILKVIFFIV